MAKQKKLLHSLPLYLSLLVCGAVFGFSGYFFGLKMIPEVKMSINAFEIEQDKIFNAALWEYSPDTTDWITYTDTQFNFSFKHPKEFVVEEIGGRKRLNKYINWKMRGKRLGEYLGDGPRVIRFDDINFSVAGTKRYEQIWGPIADIPHEEVIYEIPNLHSKGEDDKYINVVLSSVANVKSNEEWENINKYLSSRFVRYDGVSVVKLDLKRARIFDQIMTTFVFE